MIVFEVADVIGVDGDDAVAGRVVSGSPRIGTVFDRVYKDNPLFNRSAIPDVEIRLTVTKLNTWGKDRDALPEGIAGGMILDGNGINHLEPWVYIAAND